MRQVRVDPPDVRGPRKRLPIGEATGSRSATAADTMAGVALQIAAPRAMATTHRARTRPSNGERSAVRSAAGSTQASRNTEQTPRPGWKSSGSESRRGLVEGKGPRMPGVLMRDPGGIFQSCSVSFGSSVPC